MYGNVNGGGGSIKASIPKVVATNTANYTETPEHLSIYYVTAYQNQVHTYIDGVETTLEIDGWHTETILCPAGAEFRFQASDSSNNITIRKQEILI